MKITVMFFLVAALSVQAATAEETLDNFRDDLGRWVTFYYMKPEPQKVTETFVKYANSELFGRANGRLPMAAFFAAIFRDNPDLMRETYWQVSQGGSRDAKLLLVYAVRLANTPESRALFTQARTAWTSDGMQQVFGEAEKLPAPGLLEGEITQPVHLDMLWATFFATGESAPIEKIISILRWSEEGKGIQVALGGAASWSLASNAYQHKRVYEICALKLLETGDPVTKRLLQEAVDRADERKSAEGESKEESASDDIPASSHIRLVVL